jgi:hypothetical protein
MAWIAPVIGAVASLYSSYKSNQQQKSAQQLQQNSINQQQDILNQTSPYAKQYMQMGMNSITPAQNYYSSLLSGNRYLMQETLAPELNSMAKRYSGSMSAARSLYPRGGMGLAQAAQLPYDYNSQVSNAMFGARRDAAGQMANMGTQLSGLGLNAYGLNANIGNNNLDAAMRLRQIASNQGQQAGQGFFGALQQFQNWYQNYGSNNNNNSNPSSLPYGNVNGGTYPPNNWTPYGNPGSSNMGGSSPTPNPYSFSQPGQ